MKYTFWGVKMNKELKKENKIKVNIKHYRFDISKPQEAKEYEDLCKHIKKTEGHKKDTTHYINFQHNSQHKREFTKKIIQLTKKKHINIDATYLFENQFNTDNENLNLRVYYWNEYIYINKKIKEGYYLVKTQELKERVHNTFKCGYCGARYTEQEKKKLNLKFCNSCLESEYLTLDYLPLLRLKRIDDKTKRPELNQEDKIYLMQSFQASQLKGQNKRTLSYFVNKKKEIKEIYNKEKENINIEYKGKMWLLLRGIHIKNVIYYNYNNMWVFGWQNKLTFEEEQDYKKALKNFPFNYKLKVE